MKAKELREQSDEQLSDSLRAAARDLFQLRFRSATEKLNAPSAVREIRRRIARIKTIQRERELAASRSERG
jgi:large subunit ribosomal protein L29